MADKSAHKAKVRARILDEAAIALRSGGTEGLSVANLMKRAGLTHGGFYAHFENRDDLVAHAVDRMFEDSRAMLERFLGDRPDLGGLIDHYLSEAAMRRHDLGCPLPWLAGEAPRMPDSARRRRFQAGISAMRDAIAGALVRSGHPKPEADACRLDGRRNGRRHDSRPRTGRRRGSGRHAAGRARASRTRGVTASLNRAADSGERRQPGQHHPHQIGLPGGPGLGIDALRIVPRGLAGQAQAAAGLHDRFAHADGVRQRRFAIRQAMDRRQRADRFARGFAVFAAQRADHCRKAQGSARARSDLRSNTSSAERSSSRITRVPPAGPAASAAQAASSARATSGSTATDGPAPALVRA
jgi:TetR/AcrR family transcriptional repressor of nem operon